MWYNDVSIVEVNVIKTLFNERVDIKGEITWLIIRRRELRRSRGVSRG